jgi:hypothetical protein
MVYVVCTEGVTGTPVLLEVAFPVANPGLVQEVALVEIQVNLYVEGETEVGLQVTLDALNGLPLPVLSGLRDLSV